VLHVRLTNHDISKSYVRLCSWDSASDAYHQAEPDLRELRLYLDCDCGGRVGASLACRKTCDDDVVFADAAESVQR
jgi:hypothetical protein